MKALTITYKPDDEFFIDEGCYITELSNDEHDPEVSIARARVPTGVTTQWHRLKDTVERYCILEGEGVVEIGELPAKTIKPYNVVIIPPLCRQRIANIGEGDLVFLALCSPRFQQHNYEALDAD